MGKLSSRRHKPDGKADRPDTPDNSPGCPLCSFPGVKKRIKTMRIAACPCLKKPQEPDHG